MAKKEMASIQVYREDGEQYLEIKVPAELEKLFSTDSTKESSKYLDEDGDNVSFYTLSSKLAKFSEKYNQVLVKGRKIALREYGTKLMKNGYANLSILRTEGISDGIKVAVEELILDDEVSMWITSLASFLKFLNANYLEERKIVANIEMEF